MFSTFIAWQLMRWGLRKPSHPAYDQADQKAHRLINGETIRSDELDHDRTKRQVH
jgi:hypothetical protein